MLLVQVNTRKETVIDCEMAEDRQEIFFNFSSPFEIHDDTEILTRMDMQRCALPSNQTQWIQVFLLYDCLNCLLPGGVDFLPSFVPAELVDFATHHLYDTSDTNLWQPDGLRETDRKMADTSPLGLPSALPIV
jgi:hypothetical protein